MIENRAVGTNGDIHRRKHASQGKKVIFYFIFDKLICRVGRVNRVGRVTPIKHLFFLGLSLGFLEVHKVKFLSVRDLQFTSEESYNNKHDKTRVFGLVHKTGTYRKKSMILMLRLNLNYDLDSRPN